MRIAFDLDDTLIPGLYDFPLERRGLLGRLLAHEEIRKGTVSLMRSLIKDGWEVWIYTTSFRTSFYVKSLFRLHGVRIAGVINQGHHIHRISKCGEPFQDCSKYPPAFGIDLLVDESEGVWLESRRHGFEVVPVSPDDENWADVVVAKARRSSNIRRGHGAG